jgi:hypothetical protein
MLKTLLLLLTLTLSLAAEVRVYVMPTVGTVMPRGTLTEPKYAPTILRPNGIVHEYMTMGSRPVCITVADVTPAVHASLVANTDVVAWPASFQLSGATLSTNVTAFSSSLEALGVPMQWATNQDTYLATLHTIGGMFQFIQRVSGIVGSDPFTSATLNTRVNQLPAGVQSAISQACSDLVMVCTSITGSTTLRNLYKNMSDQWGLRPLNTGNFQF